MTSEEVEQKTCHRHWNSGRKQTSEQIAKRVASTKITMAAMPQELRDNHQAKRLVSCDRFSPKPTFIYTLSDPRDPKEVRYLGKTVSTLERRYERHRGSAARGTKFYVYNWWRKMVAEGFEPVINLVDTVPPQEDWVIKETAWIENLREEGHRLTNQCDGGQGSTGAKRSEETVQRLRESHIGIKRTVDSKAKSGAKSKAAWARDHRTRSTPESLAKMHATRAIRRGLGLYKKRRPASPETIEKIRTIKKANQVAGLVVLSPEGRAAISAANIARNLQDEPQASSP